MQDEIEVTQADREAAHNWLWMLYDPRDVNPILEANDAVEELAEDFALDPAKIGTGHE